MNHRCPIVASALALVLFALPSFQEPRSEEKGDEHESELAQRMESIEQRIKVIRKALREEGGHATALAALVEVERLALECKGLEPELAAGKPEAERAQLVTAYRREMVDFLMRQLELEAALLDGNSEAAKQAFERLRGMEDPAHERFAPEEAEKKDDDR